MKKILSILSIFLFITTGKAQEAPISRIADFDMPEKLLPIDLEKGESLVKLNYKYLTNVKNTKHMFAYGTILVGIKEYDKRQVDLLDLNAKRNQWLEIIKQTKMEQFITRSDIIQIKNTSFLVMGQYYQDEYAYNILSATKGNTGLGIQIQFKKSQKAEADKLMMQILSGISFHPATIVKD